MMTRAGSLLILDSSNQQLLGDCDTMFEPHDSFDVLSYERTILQEGLRGPNSYSRGFPAHNLVG
jgi:hypothetical protein